MEMKTESKEQEWKDSISRSSSSRSSSITSDSSDGHFDIRHFPLPKPTLSASEAQKQRKTYQAYSSSYTGSSWSSGHQNHMVDLPGYDPNRIPSSVFSSKPGNSSEWSIASNESLFSIHDMDFNISTKEDHVLGTTQRLSEFPIIEETIHEITEIDPVPLPSVKKPTEHEKEAITQKKPDHVEKSESDSESEIDDYDVEIEEGEMTEIESDDEHEEEDMIQSEVLVETETEIQEEKIVEDLKENKPEDTNSTTSHSPSISCRSDISNNSISSFVFPLLQKEDGVDKTPSMVIRGNTSQNRRPKYLMPQSQPSQPQPYSESGTVTQLQPQSLPQRKASIQNESQMQSPKASKNGWFSCFQCTSKCGLFN
ncbi:unnamed protein product [Microthlaspi erraticum]|uniref:Uncharacterized protein n=1 Tax=Microthlaspi erraticum TaxID=1685480 RepID=A0A6D2JFN4_9BRAS|nr:unnamed protein product [Microthlaspi erraticum]